MWRSLKGKHVIFTYFMLRVWYLWRAKTKWVRINATTYFVGKIFNFWWKAKEIRLTFSKVLVGAICNTDEQTEAIFWVFSHQYWGSFKHKHNIYFHVQSDDNPQLQLFWTYKIYISYHFPQIINFCLLFLIALHLCVIIRIWDIIFLKFSHEFC